MPKKLLIPLGVLLLVFAGVFGWLKFHDIFNEESPEQQTKNQQTTIPDDDDPKQQQTPAFDKTTHSLTEAGSLWWIVNKTRPLEPKTYVPDNLVFPDVSLRVPGNESMKIRSDVAVKIKEMFDGAKASGFNLMFSSGYRSYNYQVSLYNSYVNSQGQAEADKQSARPGYSEHQTGLAFDVCDRADCDLVQSFGSTTMGKWVAGHAHEYGFIIRYLEGKDSVTGYMYEPWHLRFVGTELATELHNTGQTMEEFFGLPAAPDYL